MNYSLKKKLFALLAVTAFSGSGLAFAATTDKSTEVQIRYWKPSLTADVKSDGDALNMKDTFGMEGKKVPQFDIQTLTPRGDRTLFRTAYFETKYKGDTTLVNGIRFQGKDYGAGQHVISELDLKYLRAGWMRYLNKNGAEDKTKLFLITEFKILAFDVAINNNNGINEKKRAIAPIPAIGFAVDSQLKDKVGFCAEVSGLPLGRYGHILEGDIGIKYTSAPKDSLNFMIGYRLLDIDVKNNDDYLKVKFAGPYFSLQARI